MLMRRIGIQRRRSRGWWGVFLCACLATGVYVAFDILDLDGSDLREPLPGNAIAAEPVGAEAERFQSQALSTPEPSHLAFLPLNLSSTSDSPRVSPGVPLSTIALRLGHLRPRASLHRETISSTSTAGDPA